jgi:hypothetical protein
MEIDPMERRPPVTSINHKPVILMVTAIALLLLIIVMLAVS